eukprot:6214815-Lingulodinium_polyedra.AAC.1
MPVAKASIHLTECTTRSPSIKARRSIKEPRGLWTASGHIGRSPGVLASDGSDQCERRVR